MPPERARPGRSNHLKPSATGPRAVLGSQRVRAHRERQKDLLAAGGSSLPRAEDGARSEPVDLVVGSDLLGVVFGAASARATVDEHLAHAGGASHTAAR